MEYEIKNISLTSVLKVSFLVALTVSSIVIMFFTLIIARLANFINTTLETAGSMELIKNIDFDFFTIVFGSIFNGLILTGLILFVIALAIIFYNLYARYVGGVKIELKNDNQLN
ncbi:MAG TPA: DUF3566 domain-containing protein [bacterium]|nr:DUF3566 domain-containing protein [bacterium]